MLKKQNSKSLVIFLCTVFIANFAQAEEVKISSGNSNSVHITSSSDSYVADLMFTCDMGDYDTYYLQLKIDNKLFPELALQGGDKLSYTLYSDKEKLFGEIYTGYVLENAKKWNEPIDRHSVFVNRQNLGQYLINGLEANVEHIREVQGKEEVKRHKVTSLALKGMMNKYPQAMDLCKRNNEQLRRQIEKAKQEQQQQKLLYFLTNILPMLILVSLIIAFRNKLVSLLKQFTSNISGTYNKIKMSWSKRKLSKVVEEEIIREKVREEIKKQRKEE